jgi:hypothetical protein
MHGHGHTRADATLSVTLLVQAGSRLLGYDKGELDGKNVSTIM